MPMRQIYLRKSQYPLFFFQAYWEAEQHAEEKTRAKREERVVKHWTRLIQGLRVRQRLRAQYATKAGEETHSNDLDNLPSMVIDDKPGTHEVRPST